ncbi:AI-2E family transporter [Myxacorys almedinensis]|uniref:AI-2E family transporter n=1 Tax=Myxacorys almedinensis A TaxID=2690445 RepID=A0A8J7Z3V4_9CYAN|nr:AI-2E family transporter [Myxacorys almedinensis]NDJ15988.1 AI-2E family transporter [Myxacorys almedinensis A]
MRRRSVNPQRFLVLGLIGPIAALNIWLLGQVLYYFGQLVTVLTVSAILAFLLNYPVRWFERVRIKRTGAVVIVLLLTVAVLAVSALTLVPILLDQTNQLLIKIPGWLEASRQNLDFWDEWAKQRNLPIDLRGFGGKLSLQIENQIQAYASQALGLAIGTVSGLIDTILIIVLAFYMLLYGDRLWQGLIHQFPPKIGIPLSDSLKQNFHNFFLSQILLALFMAGSLIPLFLALKVPFTLLFALFIGIAELIPFIGAALGIGIVTILVMFQSVWLAFQVALAAVILQQIRDNLLAPKILGDFTGLNPIWIFIALLIGLQIAGLLGVIVAVPIAGTIKGTIDALRLSHQPPVIVTEPVIPPPPSQ